MSSDICVDAAELELRRGIYGPYHIFYSLRGLVRSCADWCGTEPHFFLGETT
jgi:hypothetical protein